MIYLITLYFIPFFVLGVGLQFSLDHNAVINGLYSLTYAGLFLIGAVLAFWNRSSLEAGDLRSKPLLFVGIAEAANSILLILNTSITVFRLQMNIPIQSILAYVYLFTYFPLLIIASIIFLKLLYLENWGNYYYYLYLFIPASLVIGFFVGTLFYFSPFNMTDLQYWQNILYSLADFTLLPLGLWIFFSSLKRFWVMSIFGLGVIFQVVGDIAYFYRYSQNIWWQGDVSDIIYLITAFVFSLWVVNFIPEQ